MMAEVLNAILSKSVYCSMLFSEIVRVGDAILNDPCRLILYQPMYNETLHLFRPSIRVNVSVNAKVPVISAVCESDVDSFFGDSSDPIELLNSMESPGVLYLVVLLTMIMLKKLTQ